MAISDPKLFTDSISSGSIGGYYSTTTDTYVVYDTNSSMWKYVEQDLGHVAPDPRLQFVGDVVVPEDVTLSEIIRILQRVANDQMKEKDRDRIGAILAAFLLAALDSDD